MEYIKEFGDFINESKNYNLYRAISLAELKDILAKGKLICSGRWETPMRKNVNIPYGISCTRNFSYTNRLSNIILEFDVPKLSSKFKIIPFSENPDFYIDIHRNKKDIFNDIKNNFTGDENKHLRIKKYISDKRLSDIYWKVKTDTKHFDFGIAEEVIVAKEIPFNCIKRIYYNSRYNVDLHNIDGIENFEIVPFKDKDKNLASVLYKK